MCIEHTIAALYSGGGRILYMVHTLYIHVGTRYMYVLLCVCYWLPQMQ